MTEGGIGWPCQRGPQGVELGHLANSQRQLACHASEPPCKRPSSPFQVFGWLQSQPKPHERPCTRTTQLSPSELSDPQQLREMTDVYLRFKLLNWGGA